MKKRSGSEMLDYTRNERDLEILRKVYFQEILAEKRYSKHIANVSANKVRELLVNLLNEEKEHKDVILSEIKRMNPKFKTINDDLWEMQISKDLMAGVGNEISVIKAILQINIEKEKEAIKQYIGYSKEAEGEEVKALLKGFSIEEQTHLKRLNDMLESFE